MIIADRLNEMSPIEKIMISLLRLERFMIVITTKEVKLSAKTSASAHYILNVLHSVIYNSHKLDYS